MQHIIKKQILEVHLDRKQNAFLMQQRMSEYYYKQIIPILERIFDELAGENEILELDKLEIDLGKIGVRELELNRSDHKLYGILFSQIREAITKVKKQQKPFHSAYPLSVARQWLFYIQHGYLPWNTLVVNEVWYAQALEAFAVDFDSVTALRKVILSDKLALQRIVSQHTESFRLKLAEILTAEKQADLFLLTEELVSIMEAVYRVDGKSAVFDKVTIRKIVWQFVMTVAASGKRNLTTQRVAEIVVKEILKGKPMSQEVWNNLEGKVEIIEPVVRAILKGTDGEPENLKGMENRIDHFDDIILADRNNDSAGQPANGVDLAEKTPSIKTTFEEIVESSADDNVRELTLQVNEEGIFVHDAGLVLLHPFFPIFFTRMQLIKDGKFSSRTSQQRALHLLFYLANGLRSPEEHQLVIPKLLCAYALEDTVEKSIILREDEIKEADDLLVAAIAQWTIVKNTSTAGLRDGFLQRSGKLYSRNGNLYIQVETSSIDILLDHLPWGLSMIKLPWMKELLKVEWR